jgi:hypothetical protein
MDLGGGRYPAYNEEWLLDGSPAAPYRQNMSRRDVTGLFTPSTAQAVIYVVPVCVQGGDIFGAVSFCVKTAATGTSTHSWAAVYNGVATGAALLAQSSDVTGGFAAGANTLDLEELVANIGTQGIPQGPSSPAITPSGAAVWGVALYNSSGTNGPVIDGSGGGNTSGEVAHAGQVPLLSSGTLAATATAPAVLPTMAAATATLGIPYVLLSRS